MNKLIIHPKDRSTTFLNRVYENLDDITLVQGGVTKTQLKDMIKVHDQVWMMGHGTPHGLMGVGQFNAYGDIVDDTFADLLAEKDNSVFIWCNADQYVGWNKLSGFYTGMFISEVGEARCMGLTNATQDDVDESNLAFVDIMGDAANDDPELMHKIVTDQYGRLAAHNPVAKYNHERLHYELQA